ncbi:MAG TPA: SGNH/GDSL hydrolase family protein [Verrucomicrobiae bacterium]|nr:SGNH/GDSL hydrolase family protein [Verrucomicrobiae bacterium]
MTKQVPARRLMFRIVDGLACLLGFAVVFLIGAYVHAFAAFALLPVAIAFCALRFFKELSRRAQPAKWPALLSGNVLILALLLSLLFLGFETYYRFICDRTDAMGNTLVSTAWYRRYFHKNTLDLRDNIEYPMARDPNKRRITFVGDSFTAGFGVKDVEDRFVNRIRRRHPEWEIHAAARPGLDTSTEVDLMHNLTVSNHYRIDVVVLVYQINDIGEVMPGWVQGYRKMMADEFRNSWLCQNSYFVNLFYHRWQLRQDAYMSKYFDEVEAAYQGPLWEIEKIGLLAFQNLTKVRGGNLLLVVTFPYMDQAKRFKSVHEQLDRYWKEKGVAHLDLLPVFSNLPPSKIIANPHDAHPNEYAHQLAAEAIDEFLQREINQRRTTSTNSP